MSAINNQFSLPGGASKKGFPAVRTACASKLLPLLLLLTLPAVVQAQFSYTVNNGTITITGGPGGAVTIPSTINGLPVTSIGDDAFWFCYSLTSVAIGNSVTNIGDSAFCSCSLLTSVTIPSSVTSIGGYAFSDCTSLTGVYFEGNAPSAASIWAVFYGDNNATVYYLLGTRGWGATFGGAPTGKQFGFTIKI